MNSERYSNKQKVFLQNYVKYRLLLCTQIETAYSTLFLNTIKTIIRDNFLFVDYERDSRALISIYVFHF